MKITSHSAKLREYINTLPPVDRAQFEERVGTTIGYLRKAASIDSMLSPALCVAIERASGGMLTRRDLRPADWIAIWPELAQAQGITAPHVTAQVGQQG